MNNCQKCLINIKNNINYDITKELGKSEKVKGIHTVTLKSLMKKQKKVLNIYKYLLLFIHPFSRSK